MILPQPQPTSVDEAGIRNHTYTLSMRSKTITILGFELNCHLGQSDFQELS